METRLKKDNYKNEQKRHRKLHVFLASIVVLLIVVILLLVTPQGNTITHKLIPSVNTPMDLIVKREINEQVQNNPNLTQRDKKSFSKLSKDTPMSQFSNAATSANDAATLYSKYSGKDKSTARDMINVIYSDSRLDKFRNDVANNHWIAAAQQYKKLKNSNVLSEVFTKSEKNSSNSAQKLEKRASKLYNKAVKSQTTVSDQ